MIMCKTGFAKFNIFIAAATFLVLMCISVFCLFNTSHVATAEVAEGNDERITYYVYQGVNEGTSTVSNNSNENSATYYKVFSKTDLSERDYDFSDDLNFILSLIRREAYAQTQQTSSQFIEIIFCGEFDSQTLTPTGECVYDNPDAVAVDFSDVVFGGKIKSESGGTVFSVNGNGQSQAIFYADGLNMSYGTVEVLNGEVNICGDSVFTLKTSTPFVTNNLTGKIGVEWSGEKVIDETVVLSSCSENDVNRIFIEGYALKFLKTENGNTAVLTERLNDLNATDTNEGLTAGEIAAVVVGAVGGTAAVSAAGFSISWFGVKKRSWSDLIEWFKKIKNSKEYKAVKKARKIKKKIDKHNKKAEKKRRKEAEKNGYGLY